MRLVDLNYIFECDWLIELSDNKLSNNKLSNNIKSDANGQQYQKWLFAVSEITKIGMGFISIFLLKARVSYLTISKRKNLSLPLKDETDQFVSVFLSKLHFNLGQWSESWRRWCRVSFSIVFLFFCLIRTLAHEKRSENCLRFATSGSSLCLYPLL